MRRWARRARAASFILSSRPRETTIQRLGVRPISKMVFRGSPPSSATFRAKSPMGSLRQLKLQTALLHRGRVGTHLQLREMLGMTLRVRSVAGATQQRRVVSIRSRAFALIQQENDWRRAAQAELFRSGSSMMATCTPLSGRWVLRVTVLMTQRSSPARLSPLRATQTADITCVCGIRCSRTPKLSSQRRHAMRAVARSA